MILTSLPDAIEVRKKLTLGKDYEVQDSFGTNGVLIVSDDPDLTIAILESRFEKCDIIQA